MVERAGAAGLELKAHPHMLREACGYALANRGYDARAIQAWLGNRSITSTAVYTALAPNQFKDFWREFILAYMVLQKRATPRTSDMPV
jgi:site-specific recombinase XerD